MRRYGQLKKLTLPEWQLLVVSTVLLPLTALALHLVGLRRTQYFMATLSPRISNGSLIAQQDLQQGQRVARMVTIASNHSIYGASCLERSLLTCWLLKYYGISTDLRIGVRKDDDDLDAHSWVEISGKVLAEDENNTELYRTVL